VSIKQALEQQCKATVYLKSEFIFIIFICFSPREQKVKPGYLLFQVGHENYFLSKCLTIHFFQAYTVYMETSQEITLPFLLQ